MNTQSFYYYLKNEGLAERTIDEHVKDIKRFNEWVIANDLATLTHITYADILSYVQFMQTNFLSIPTINIRINSIRKYYEHLKQEGFIENNPTRKLYIKGAVKKVVQNPLSFNELEALYQQYTTYLDQKPVREQKHKQTHLRSKVILGLMIWQGVHSGELQKMEVIHVKLNQGSVYIPGTAKSRGRELQLFPQQIISLHTYLNTLQSNQIHLFDCDMHNQIIRITNELKGINGLVKNGLHIRASVILHWLKVHDKRQVQYMIGHKWISSTEHYQEQDLGSLTDQLTNHHPFG